MKVLLQTTLFLLPLLAASACRAQTQTATPAPTPTPMFATVQGSVLKTGRRHNHIITADINKDGKLDLITCDEGDTVTLYLGNGRGGFAPAGEPIRAAAHIAAAGDLNNDGNADIALTHHDRSGVEVFLGSGTGRFTRAAGSPFAAHGGTRAHNHGLELNDLNSDGNLDITTSNQAENSVSVLLGNGKGGFAPAPGSPFAVGRAPYPHEVADVNMDGKPDIVAPNVGSNNVSVLLGDGRGGFAQAAGSPFGVAFRPYYAAIADMNGDGKPDIITTHDDITSMSTLLGDGKGGFVPAPNSPYDLGVRGYQLAAADVNGDKRADLVIGSLGGVIVLLTDGKGGCTPAAGSPYMLGADPRIAVGDTNGDGRLDIIVSSGQGEISVLSVR